MLSLAYAFSVLTVFTTIGVAPTPAPVARSEGPVVVVSIFSEKIGVKPMPSSPLELELGHSFTASVSDPGKLHKSGISGMHEGARVTVTRLSADKLRVEAEEMEPVEHKEIVNLAINGDGTFTVIQKK